MWQGLALLALALLIRWHPPYEKMATGEDTNVRAFHAGVVSLLGEQFKRPFSKTPSDHARCFTTAKPGL